MSLEEKLLTSEELAEKLQIHPATILRYAREQILPVIKVGGTNRFILSDVVAAMQKPQVPVGRRAYQKEGRPSGKLNQKAR